MHHLRFRLLNVFAESRLGGNALCVFEDGSALTDAQMQALALQMNLSETTFLLPSSSAGATARVRIFTPSFEMPFAGHPTLGTAQVARALFSAKDHVTLEMKAGVIPVTAVGDVWTLEARSPKARPPQAKRAELAAMLGLDESDVGQDPLWVDTGSEQLVIPLTTADAVARCRPDARVMAAHGRNGRGDELVYVFADDDTSGGTGKVISRFFFFKQGAVVEDPGTGSACANLGGWLITTGATLPATREIRQGEQTGRPCHLGLRVDAEKRIFVTGRVIEIGGGEIAI
jgi:PhzF family phenazine biosynthesis protein